MYRKVKVFIYMKFFEVVSKIFPIVDNDIVNTIAFFVVLIIGIVLILFGVKKASPETKASALWKVRIIVFLIFMAIAIGFAQIIYWVGLYGRWWGLLAGLGFMALVVAAIIIFFVVVKKKQKQKEETKENS